MNQTAAFTACKASSIRGRGNESRIVTAFRALKLTHKRISPVFFTDNNYLRRVRASQRPNDTLLEPGVKALANLGLQLDWDRTVRQVYGLVRCRGDYVLQTVTKTKVFITQRKHTLIVIDELQEPLMLQFIHVNLPHVDREGKSAQFLFEVGSRPKFWPLAFFMSFWCIRFCATNTLR